jgi:hypothetical protein
MLSELIANRKKQKKHSVHVTRSLHNMLDKYADDIIRNELNSDNMRIREYVEFVEPILAKAIVDFQNRDQILHTTSYTPASE